MVKKIIILFCLVGLVVGCEQKPQVQTYKKTFVTSGTYLTVTSFDEKAAKIVHEEFKRLNDIFNIYDPESELSKLNNTYKEKVKVSDDLFELLQLSLEVNELTDRAFDVSYGVLYEFWKNLIESGSIKDMPSKRKVNSLKKRCGMKYIVMDAQDKTVTITKKGLKIDMSAIAKGYMVDKAVMKLKEQGIDNVLINAGGDLYCLGQNLDENWTVGIRDPRNKKNILVTEELVDEAVATSGDYEQFFEHKGSRYSHIVDPRTGFPPERKVISTSVITKNCTTADSLSTAFVVMGIEGIEEFLSRVPSSMRIYAMSEDERGLAVRVFK